jgi:hypothetical protein
LASLPALVARLSSPTPKRKNPAQWPGLVVWCLPLSAVAPIEDDYFLQVDSGGSNPVLMPPGE